MVDPRTTRALIVACLLIASTVPLTLALADDPPVPASSPSQGSRSAPQPAYDSMLDLVARMTTTPPDIDGVVDPVWSDALALDILTSGSYGNYDLYLKAMFDDDYIYMLAQWDESPPAPTAREDKDRDAWQLTSNVTPGTWSHQPWGEDRLSFLFEDHDRAVTNFSSAGCDAVCHNDESMYTLNDGEVLDAWVWSAATTNHQSYSDDAQLRKRGTVQIDPKYMHVTKSDLAWDGGAYGWFNNNDTGAGGARPTHIWDPSATPQDRSFMYESDAQEVDWGSFDVTTLPQKYLVPGHVLGMPGGDRAHVQTKGVHNGTGWTVEFKRLRDTGSANDTIFDDTNVPYHFSPAIANNVTGEDHSKGVAVYKLWLASPELPDLVVDNVIPVRPYQVNSTIETYVSVENIGWEDAGATQISWYWDTGGAPRPTLVDVPAIGWGQDESVSFNVTTDGLQPGNNTLVLTADANDDVVEINESNNGMRTVLDLEPEPLPNLHIDTVSVRPSVPTEGSLAKVTVRVGNDGTNASPPARLILYLEDPGSPLAEATVPGLAIDGSHDSELDWQVSVVEGEHVLNATVDPDGEVRELNETDNSGELTVTVEAPTLPDLVIEEITPLNETVVQETETWTRVVVANVGGAPATDTFQVGLFLNQAFTIGNIGLMATEEVSDDLAAGKNVTLDMKWTVPGDTDVGADNFIRAEADMLDAVEELDESNNNATFSGLMVIRPPLPDLTIPSVYPDSPTVKLESWLRMTVTVRNQGNLSSSNTTLSVMDSTHNTTLENLSVPGLRIGEEADLDFEWYASSSAGAKVGRISLLFIVDPLDQVREESEFNNARTTSLRIDPPDLPDLTFSQEGLTFFPETPRVGDQVTITFQVVNEGTNASEDTEVRVFLGGEGGTPIATVNILGLGVNESTTKDVFWPAEEILSASTYNVVAVIDPNDNVKESDKENNAHATNITFVKPPRPQLDNLSVSSDKDKAEEGDELTLTVTFANVGNDAGVVTIVIKDNGVETDSRQGLTVAVGGSRTETFTIKMEGVGDHVLVATLYLGDEVAQDPDGEDMTQGVTVQVTDAAEGDGSNLVIALVVVIVVLVVLVAVFYFLSQRK